MSKRSTAEQKFLEPRLEKAFDDVWSKVNSALDETSKPSDDVAMRIWFAAEAAEYASLLFNLTHGLEDMETKVKNRKGEDPAVLVRDSMLLLKRAREAKEESPRDAYVNLRTAADYLKAAHLGHVKKSTVKRG